MSTTTREVHGLEVCARVIIIQNDALLLCQAQGKGYYFIPGGHIEFGESAEQCLIRELQEECGLDLEVGAYIGTVENFFTQEGTEHHEYNHVFTGSIATAEVRSLEKHISFTWVPLSAIAATHIEPMAMLAQIIRWLDQQKSFWATQYEKH